MFQRRIYLASISTAILLLINAPFDAHAAEKLGGKCTKKGATTEINGVVAKCDDSAGKGLTWNSTGQIKNSGAGNSQSASGQNKSPNLFSGNPENPPKFIVANFVDPSKIYLITKFRSGVGHDFSTNSGETCRSMKHYLSALDPAAPDYKIEGNGEKSAMPTPVQGVDVPIYSPVDGVVSIEVGDGIPINQAVDIVPNNYKMFTIRLMHVFPIKGLKVGQNVKAGQQVGLVLRNQTFDFDIETMVNDPKYKSRYISVFMAMTDNVFAQWQKRGAPAREKFVLSKASVDANPWKCAVDSSQKAGDALFAVDYMADPADFARNIITLDGYQNVTDALKKKYGR